MTLVEIHDAADAPLMVLVNNRSFDTTDRINVAKDTLERWAIINTTVDAHPMHLHFTQLQVSTGQKYDSEGYVEAAYGPGLVQPKTQAAPFPWPGT